MKHLGRFFLLMMLVLAIGCATDSTLVSSSSNASPLDPSALSGGQAFGVKSYFVNTAFYPFVSVYFKTVDANGEPLVNLTPFNVGLMIKGRAYDMAKKQYGIESLNTRDEGFRTVLVVDASSSMRGYFPEILQAAQNYIRLKKANDEIAIIALGDQVVDVCAFTKDGLRAETYLNDIKPTGSRTPLYDGVARAIAMCQSAAGTTGATGSSYIVQSNIVAITDCLDEHSVFGKDAVLAKVGSMAPPIPIYTMGLIEGNRIHQGHVDMAAISTASFGKFFPVNLGSSFVRISDKIQSINRADYVLTFRSYLPVDGNKYLGQIIINYEGRGTHDEFSFQTMEVPMMNQSMKDIKMKLENAIPALPAGMSPYVQSSSDAQQMSAPTQAASTGSVAPAPAAKAYKKKAAAAAAMPAPSMENLPGR
ncbi:MAG: VWA domain-containing protein [Pseudomonadota bacterium]